MQGKKAGSGQGLKLSLPAKAGGRLCHGRGSVRRPARRSPRAARPAAGPPMLVAGSAASMGSQGRALAAPRPESLPRSSLWLASTTPSGRHSSGLWRSEVRAAGAPTTGGWSRGHPRGWVARRRAQDSSGHSPLPDLRRREGRGAEPWSTPGRRPSVVGPKGKVTRPSRAFPRACRRRK
jgi:hypothetical protein